MNKNVLYKLGLFCLCLWSLRDNFGQKVNLEYHFLLVCPMYNELRREYLPKY